MHLKVAIIIDVYQMIVWLNHKRWFYVFDIGQVDGANGYLIIQ